MPKVRADAWPPCEPRLKASRVATMKMAGIAAREKNLQRVAKNLAESLKTSSQKLGRCASRVRSD